MVVVIRYIHFISWFNFFGCFFFYLILISNRLLLLATNFRFGTIVGCWNQYYFISKIYVWINECVSFARRSVSSIQIIIIFLYGKWKFHPKCYIYVCLTLDIVYLELTSKDASTHTSYWIQIENAINYLIAFM